MRETVRRQVMLRALKERKLQRAMDIQKVQTHRNYSHLGLKKWDFQSGLVWFRRVDMDLVGTRINKERHRLGFKKKFGN